MAKPFNQRVKDAREHRGLTQAALGKSIGLTQQQIERMENRPKGKRSYYTAQIANACGVNPMWLATGEGVMVLPQNLPEEALAIGAAWFHIKGGVKDTMAHRLLSTAISFMPPSHPLFKSAEKLYRDVAKRERISNELSGATK